MSEEEQLQPEVTKKKSEAKIKENKPQSGWELVRFGVIALIAVLGIRAFIVQPFIVSGSSMFPTFENGQYLIIDEISYKFHEPQRDDVIVFKYPNDTTKFFIKRTIGLPGETVDVKGSAVTITSPAHPNGFTLLEPYVQNLANSNTHFVLQSDEYFVMGDNRPNSSDSRFWGPVNKDLIIGKVLTRLWPVSKVGILPGDYKQSEVK